MRPGLCFIWTWLILYQNLAFTNHRPVIYQNIFMLRIIVLSLCSLVLSETGLLLRNHQKGWGRYGKVQQRAGEKQDGSDLGIYLCWWAWTFTVAQSLWRRAKGAEKNPWCYFLNNDFRTHYLIFCCQERGADNLNFKIFKLSVWIRRLHSWRASTDIYFV